MWPSYLKSCSAAIYFQFHDHNEIWWLILLRTVANFGLKMPKGIGHIAVDRFSATYSVISWLWYSTLNRHSLVYFSLWNFAAQDCAICCDKLSGSSGYGSSVAVVQLNKCKHLFHKECLDAMYNNGTKVRLFSLVSLKIGSKKMYSKKIIATSI